MANDKEINKGLEEAVKEGYKGGASKSIKLLAQISADIKSNSKSSEAALKYVEATNTLSELSYRASSEETAILEQALAEVAEKLSSPNQTDQQIQNRLAELSSLQEKANTIAQTMEADLKADNVSASLSMLSDRLKDQTKTLEASTSTLAIENGLKSLEGLMGFKSDESTMMLRETFEMVTQDLQDSIAEGDQMGIELARQQLKAIAAGVESEEKRREAQKLQEEANSTLHQMASSLSNMSKKFDDIAKGITSGGGFLAGAAALALAFFDPAKFTEIFSKVFNSLKEVFEGIVKIFTGDIEGGLSLLGDNLFTVGAIIGGIALQFGGAIIGKLGTLFTIVGKLMTALKIFRVFMMGTFIPAIIGAFSTMITALTPILVAAAPFIAIGAAIGLALWGLYELLDYLKEKLNVSSIGDVLRIGVAYLQDGLGQVANFVIDLANGILAFIKDKGGALLDFLGIDFEIPDMKIDRVDTNNAQRVTQELQAKKVEDDLKAAQEEAKKPKLEIAAPIAGAELDIGSYENMVNKEAMATRSAPVITSASSNSADNSVTNTTIIQAPTSFASQSITSAFAR